MQVTYKLEQHLKTICSENKEYEDLFATWNINKRSYCEALEPITQNYPHYTEHGASHSETILANIELLLGGEQIRRLSPTDTWLILQAAYLHDIGMSLLYKDIENMWKTEEFQEYLYELKESCDGTLRDSACYILDMKENIMKKDFPQNWPVQVRRHVTIIISDYYRRRHGEISKEYIEKMNNLWGIDLDFNGLIQERLIKLLGQISHLHTQTSDDIMKLEYKSIGHNADYIHPRFVAEMIRMGDLLDVDNNRFNTYIYRTIGSLPESSQNHIEKHKSTRHILITPEEIEYKADCPTQEVYRETRVFLSWLIKETDFLAKEWKSIVPENFVSSAPKLGKTEILLEGKPDLNGVADLRFNISQEKAFQIIEGTNLYNDKYIYIRELIQNALDTCKLQMWRDLCNGKYSAWVKKEIKETLNPFDIDPNIYRNYKVEISTRRLDDGMVEIIVMDNGTGISVETFKQMCDVGMSYWGKKDLRKEIDNMPSWLRPTAGFGIGLQSVFLVTDHFEIISTCNGNEIKAVVESRKKNGFVQISASNTEWKRGTKIIVKVPEAKVQDVDVQEYDPFAKENRLLELVLKREIKRTCSSTYFPITLYIDDKECGKIDAFAFEELDDTWVDDGKFKYKIGNDLTDIQIWDKEHAIFYEMDLCLKESEFWGNRNSFQLFFKGMRLSDEEMQMFSGIRCKMDIYGMETKSSLSLNRGHLLQDARKKVGELRKEINEFYLRKTKQIWEEIDDEVFMKKWGGKYKVEKIYSYFCLLSLADKIHLKTKHSLRMGNLKKTIDVLLLNHDTKQIEKKQIELIELIKNIEKVSCISYIGIALYYDSEDIFSFTQKNLEDGIISTECKYVVTSFDAQYTFYNYGVESVTYLGKNILLFHMSEKEQKKVFLAENDKHVFYSQILFWEQDEFLRGRGMRNAVPAVAEFSELVVRKLPQGVSWGGDSRIHDIISPLLKTDIELMEKYEKEAYIDMVLQRDDFEKMLEYVYNNQIENEKFLVEQLRGKYKELIQKSYEWYHEKKHGAS